MGDSFSIIDSIVRLGRVVKDLNYPSSEQNNTMGRGFTLWGEWLLLAGIVLLLLYTLLSYHSSSVLTGEELSHHITARGLIKNGSFLSKEKSPFHFVSQGHLFTPEGRYISKHPPGQALLIAAFSLLFGSKGAFLVNLILGITALIFTFFIGRELFTGWVGGLAALSLGISPTFLILANTSLPRCSSLSFLLAGVYLCIVGFKRRGTLCAILGGLLCGVAVVIQLSHIFVAIPLLTLLLMQKRAEKGRLAFSWMAGFLIPVAGLLVYNASVFGSPFTTGYGASGIDSGLNLTTLGKDFFTRATVLLPQGLTLLLPLSILGLFLSLNEHRKTGLFLILWTLSHFISETVMPPGRDSSFFQEFFLTPLPPLLFAAAFLIREAPRHLEIHRGLSIGLLVGFFLLLTAYHLSLAKEKLATLEERTNLQCEAAKKILRNPIGPSPGAVMIMKATFLNGLVLHLPESIELLELETLSPVFLRALINYYEAKNPSGLHLFRLKQALDSMGGARNEWAFLRKMLTLFSKTNRPIFILLPEREEKNALRLSRKLFEVRKIGHLELPSQGFLAERQACNFYQYIPKVRISNRRSEKGGSNENQQ